MTIPVFPTLKGLIYPVKRAPRWSTLHHEAVSGQDNPISLWTYPRWSYEIGFSFLRSDTNAEWQTLAAFFNQMRGDRGVFQFTDPDDGTVTAQGFGTGDGSTKAFALVRALAGGSFTFTEPVFAPVTVAVYDNAVLVDPANYTLGPTGLITFTSAPTLGHALTWTGTYNWLCRFDDRAAEFENFAYRFWELKKIAFTTIKTRSR